MNAQEQKAFFAALLDADRPVPAGLAHPHGGEPADRMAIYRNNVAFSLITALGDAFPLLANLLGRDAFSRVSRAYTLAHPPGDPCMFHYGAALPEFLAADEGVAHVPYIVDVARLERALNEVAHAADDEGLLPAALATGNIEDETLSFISAMHLLVSDWPLHDLYLFASGDAPPPMDMGAPQSVLVYRDADYQSHIAKLPLGGDALLRAMLDGVPLAAAAEAAPGLEEAGMVEVFSLLVQNGLITARQAHNAKDAT